MKVKVRIAVAINQAGEWGACGWNEPSDKLQALIQNDEMMNEAIGMLNLQDDEDKARYWITAEVEILEVKEIKGRASNAT